MTRLDKIRIRWKGLEGLSTDCTPADYYNSDVPYLLEVIDGLKDALEFIPDVVDVLCNDPHITDITQFTNEFFEAKQALKDLE